MSTKFRKAIGAMKDHTSISLAKVSNSSATSTSTKIDVLVLKSTTHNEIPIDDQYVSDILHEISSSQSCAAACVQAISRRIDRTRNWIVALKCLQLVFRASQAGDLFFHRELLNSMRRGSRLLKLSGFRDVSKKTSSWDYTAFVRTFALYLDERLDCVLLGKLLPPPPPDHNRLRNVKTHVVIDRIAYWQGLLDRAIAMKLTGSARQNRLVLVSLNTVVLESFDLYKDVTDGIELLIGGFFRLPHWSKVESYHILARAARQFKELAAFYDVCRSIGIGGKSDYPDMMMTISDNILRILKEFIKPNPDSNKSSQFHQEQSPENIAGKNIDDEGLQESTYLIAIGSGENSINNNQHFNGVISDLLLFDDEPGASTVSCSDDWEHILVKSANNELNEVMELDDLDRRSSSFTLPLNPFLHGINENCFSSNHNRPVTWEQPMFAEWNSGHPISEQTEVDTFSSLLDLPLRRKS